MREQAWDEIERTLSTEYNILVGTPHHSSATMTYGNSISVPGSFSLPNIFICFAKSVKYLLVLNRYYINYY
jgi:hypothetical protein